MSEPKSILSTGERRVAELLRAGHSHAEIAEIRGEPVEVIERAADRIRGKTDRALVTLAESPFLEEAVAGRDGPERERLRAALREE